MPDASIHTLAHVIQCLGEVHLAKLKNGKSLLAHRSKPLADAAVPIAVGDTVLLELTPFDFSSARIVAIGPFAKSHFRKAELAGAECKA